jgi:ParB family chromosome partitioning protein
LICLWTELKNIMPEVPPRPLNLEQIEANPFQPRKNFDEAELKELAASIEQHGLLQPVLVRPVSGKKYKGIKFQLIAGERRWRACQLAGLKTIMATVREMDDLEAALLALVENDQRADLDDFSKANGIKTVMDLSAKQGELLSERKMAQRLGRSESYVRNRMQVFKMKPDVQAMTQRHSGVLSAAYEISRLKEESDRAPIIARVDAGAGFQEVKSEVARVLEAQQRAKESEHAPDAETERRARHNAESGGGNVSRGREVTGTTSREAKKRVEELLSEADATAALLAQWAPHLDERSAALLAPRFRHLRAAFARLEKSE